MNVTKIILTRCQIFPLKCTKFNFDWGSAHTPLGELTALARTPSWLWEGKRKWREKRKGKREEGGKREGEG